MFARVSPEQKARIVRVQRLSGCGVAFLGDGVNDALALHAADVGISVDSATDVAKDAADVILLEKDLNALANWVTEGRRILLPTPPLAHALGFTPPPGAFFAARHDLGYLVLVEIGKRIFYGAWHAAPEGRPPYNQQRHLRRRARLLQQITLSGAYRAVPTETASAPPSSVTTGSAWGSGQWARTSHPRLPFLDRRRPNRCHQSPVGPGCDARHASDRRNSCSRAPAERPAARCSRGVRSPSPIPSESLLSGPSTDQVACYFGRPISGRGPGQS